MSFTKQKGLEQATLLIRLDNEGVNVNPEDFKNLDYENTYAEQVRACFDWNFKNYVTSKIPAGFRLKTTNFYSTLYWNPESEFKIVPSDNRTFLLIKGKDDVIDEVYLVS